MLSVLGLCFAALLFVFAGWVTLVITMRRTKLGLAETAGLSIAFGLGAVPLLEFYCNVAGLALNFATTLGIAGFFVLVAAAAKPTLRIRMPHLKIADKGGALLWLLVFLAVALLIFSYSHAQISVDGVAIWALKAKILLNEQGMFSDRFFDPGVLHPHKYYPLLFPLAEMTVYQFLGSVSETPAVFLIYSLILVSGALIFSSAARRAVPSGLAAQLFTLMFVLGASYGLNYFGYADCALAFFILLAVLMQWRWLKEGGTERLLAAALLSSFAIFTKNEGLLIVLAVCLAFAIRVWQTKGAAMAVKTAGVVLGIALLISLPWFAVRASLPDDDAYAGAAVFSALHNIPQRIGNVIESALGMGIILILLPYIPLLAILLISFARMRMRFGDSWFLLFTLLLWGGVLFLFYLITPYDLNWQVSSSLDRMLFQVMGVFIFAVLAVSSEAGLWRK